MNTTKTLGWASLAAALVLTASAEYELARAAGAGQYVAAALPVALDAYVIAAVRARREVLVTVLAMIAVNALSHLVHAGLVAVNVWVLVAFSALAPLILWRVHSLEADHSGDHQEAAEVTTDVTADVTAEAPAPVIAGDHLGDHSPALEVTAPAALPVTSDDRSGDRLDDHQEVQEVTAPVTAAPAVAAGQTRREVTAKVTAPATSEGASQVTAALRRRAEKLVQKQGGRITIGQLQDLGLSRRAATALRRELIAA